MKGTLLKAVIILTLLISIFTLCATADASLDNFEIIKTFDENQFDDVESSDWFYEGVKTAYEIGLVAGKTDTTFSPNSEITLAETITLACRLHNIYNGSVYQFKSTTPWYKEYVDYAIINKILLPKYQYEDFGAKVKRDFFVSILRNALPNDCLKEINVVQDNLIPDVKMSAEHSDSIYKLYRAGVIVGNDSKGTFAPKTTIDRASVATIVSRMALPDLRKNITLKKASVKSVSLTESNITLTVGDKKELFADILPKDAADKTLRWSSSDESVVKIVNGTLKAISAGTAKIKCTAHNGIFDECDVTVYPQQEIIGFYVNDNYIKPYDTIELCVGEKVSFRPDFAIKSGTSQRIKHDYNTNCMAVEFDTVNSNTTMYLCPKKEGVIAFRSTLSNGESTYFNIRISKFKIILKTPLPKTLNHYGYNNKIYDSVEITNFSYKTEEYSYSEDIDVTLCFSGTKKYDREGSGSSTYCHIGWKLYDNDGYVVDSGTCYSPAVATGEKFRNAEDTIYNLLPGIYYLELENSK